MSLIVKIAFILSLLFFSGVVYVLFIGSPINNYPSLEKSNLLSGAACPDSIYLPYKEMIRHGDSFIQVKQLLGILYENKKISFSYINKNTGKIYVFYMNRNKGKKQGLNFINSDKVKNDLFDVQILISNSLFGTFKTEGAFSIFFNDNNVVEKLSGCTIINSGV